MVFKTIHTTLGLAAMASAEATGTPINLTHMAVGDGAGNPTTPSENQTVLVREMFRAAINRVFQSPDEANRFTAEMIIPATAGGFTLREVGVFDADGSLFAVGNLPATYKPIASEGAYADTVVRLDFMVTNVSVVTLQIDPNVSVATQQWVSNNVTAAFMIPGGTTHQVLRKRSNVDGDTEWSDPTDANVVVDTVEETQTLSAAQVIVTLATATTYGLSVYIEGVRLRADEWTPHPTDPAILTLGTAFPAGTKFMGVQNEPAGSAPTPLEKSLNLADVPNKPAARANLDVFSKAEARQLSPAGQGGIFFRSTAPTGWLKANGAAVSRTAYADLFAAIGTAFGSGDGFNTFNLPDARGEFLRGWDDGRGVDADRVFGSWQADEFRSHTHGLSPNILTEGVTGEGLGGTTPGQSAAVPATGPAGGNETRPRNLAALVCIKF